MALARAAGGGGRSGGSANVVHPIDPTAAAPSSTTTSASSTTTTTTTTTTTSSSAPSSFHPRQRAVSPASVASFDGDYGSSANARAALVPTLQDWRAQIAEWFFKVADSLSMSREIVSVAISYLDRYLSTLETDAVLSLSRRRFQVVSLTCLYLATKLYDHKILPPVSIVNLSRGSFTASDIEDTERVVLAALGWRLSPPTALTFVRHFLLLLPAGAAAREVRRSISDVAKYLTELSVMDHAFAGTRASSVGLASVLTAMDLAATGTELPRAARAEFERSVRSLLKGAGRSLCSAEVAECRSRLRSTYRRGMARRGGGGSSSSRSSVAEAEAPGTRRRPSPASAAGKKRRKRFHTRELFVSPRSVVQPVGC